LWRVLALSVVVVGASGTAMAFACLQTTARMTAAVEQLNGAVVAMSKAPAPAPPPPVCAPSTTVAPATLDWPVALGMLKLDGDTFVVARRVIDAILEQQSELMTQARIVPESENGRVVGIRLFGVHPDSLLARLGFQNGDRLETIGGFEMSDPEKALDAYAHLRTSKDLSVIVNRRGSRVRLEYYIL
jgi:general secretion pathway protein C